jgi:hypothetical protein
MATKKIVKPKGQEPDEWDKKVAAELMNLEVSHRHEAYMAVLTHAYIYINI